MESYDYSSIATEVSSLIDVKKMDSVVASIYLSSSVFLALILTAEAAEHQVVFKILENDQLLAPDSRVSIGNASDVFTDIQCLVTGDNDDSDQPMKQWQVQPESLPISTPLRPNETSFNREDGILRVSSQFIQNHATDGVLTLQCLTTTNIAANLQLEITPTLFFAVGLPSEISSSEDLTSVCTSNLPSLPVSTLTVESGTSNGGTTYSYCTVDTGRGRIRSKSIVTGGTDRFSVLQFERALPPEVVEWVTGDSETISLPCLIGGATTGSPLVFFLRDGEMISSSSQRDNGIYVIGTSFMSFRVLMIEKRKGNEGLYQCVGQAGNDRSTSVVSSTYVNLQYIEEPTISLSSDSPLWREDTVIVLGQPSTPQELVLNCSIEAHPTPTLYWNRRDGNFMREVEVRQGRTGYRETAFSELRLPVSQLKATTEFTCTAVLGDRRENVSMSITAYSHVEFTEQLREVTSGMVAEQPSLSCSTTSIPVAEISWFQIFENGTTSEVTSGDKGALIREELVGDNCTVRSTLQLPPIIDLSVTSYYCQGDNGFFHSNSNTLDLLQSVPAVPEVVVKVLSPRSVEVIWTAPTSLLLLDHYTLTLYKVSSDRQQRPAGQSITQSASQETRLVFEDLRPFTMYAVEVEAHNIAGNSISSEPVKFKTSEAAPNTAPENVVAEAKDTDKIRVSWSPPTAGLRNGVIRSYSIFYHPITDPSLSSILNNLLETEADLDLPLGPGISYSISVAASTVARGPFSEGVIQMTYPLPPSFPSSPPIIVPGIETTRKTLPVQLPLVNTTQFSHFWVVAIRIEGVTPQVQITQDMTVPPVSASTDPPANTPYVVAEMSAATYQNNRELFIIGDESQTRDLNDFPQLYHNLPLLPGSSYTVFVRGFAPFIPPSRGNKTRARKQAEESERQYTVFSSSELLPITATLSAASEGDDGGAGQLEVMIYAAIAVGCTLVLVVVIVILVVTKKLRGLSRRHGGTADERKSSSRGQRGQSSSNNNGTLPRGLTVTGEGIKHEEHIYEDPLYLKSCEAHSDAEPMYKVPRPVSCEDMTGSPCDDIGYETIPSVSKPRPKPRNQKPTKTNRNQENPRQLDHESAPGNTTGYYELMQHPSSLGKESSLSLPTTSPTPYLKPIGVSDTSGIAAGYSLLQQTSGKPTANSTERARKRGEGLGYANLDPPSEDAGLDYANLQPSPKNTETSFKTTNSAAAAAHTGDHEPTEYVVMRSATLKY